MSKDILHAVDQALHGIEEFESIYRTLHERPERSGHEHETASLIAHQLRKLQRENKNLDVRIHTGIGGTGVVCIIQNGIGRAVLLRAELDALPLLENTGLPYSSHHNVSGARDGEDTAAMHACGHDMHMATLLCVAQRLLCCHESWVGTLIVLFQPSEEDGTGAQAMVDAGLYDSARFAVPIPDAILAGHLMPMRAGTVRTRSGVVNAAAQSILVTIYGKGGHGARPQTAVDPIIVASSIVMKLQTVVSRETAPQDAVVVTVGTLHAGSAANIISDTATMTINMRALSTEGLVRTLSAVTRIIEGECATFRCPKRPSINNTGGFPLLYNTPSLTQAVMAEFTSYFGERFQEEESPSLGSEDLCNLAIGDSQCCFWNIGCIEPELWDNVKAEDRGQQIHGMRLKITHLSMLNPCRRQS
jgi:amidohydrolase